MSSVMDQPRDWELEQQNKPDSTKTSSYQRLRKILEVIDTAEVPEPRFCNRIILSWDRKVGPPDHYLTLEIRDNFPYDFELDCHNSNGKIFHKSRNPTEAELCKWLLWIKG